MAKQRGRKQGARRGLQAVLDMRELVDEGGAVLDRPILRRDRHALDPRDSHAQASARTLGLGKGAEQRGMTLFGFPARGIDLLIGRPASRIEIGEQLDVDGALLRSEEHTSELRSLMRYSYAVFCLKKKKTSADTLE